MRLLRYFSLGVFALAAVAASASDAEAVWQWSVPAGEGRAYLWIPPNCARVRGVVLAQHNMIEHGLLEHPRLRGALAELGLAEVFVAPSLDAVYRFDRGAVERFAALLKALADESGYEELANAPVAPLGHSAHASFPWNFAAAQPDRTFAVLSVKGDAPLTGLTGSGRPNPDWGDRTLDGIPGLMVMGEYEWWEARLAPLLAYRAAHPRAPLAFLADAGHGHFDATDSLADFIALFLRKAAEARLPAEAGGALKPVEASRGWLADRWRGDAPPRAVAAPHDVYGGDKAEAFWCFDEEMARATEARYATSRAKKAQQLGFVQGASFVPISNSHAGTELAFVPASDGLSFSVRADFIVPLPPFPPVATKDKRPPKLVVEPRAAAEGTHSAGPVLVSVVTGPAEETAPGRFRVSLNRLYSANDRRTHEVWLLALSPGDAAFKPAVRQALLRLPSLDEGREQTIRFCAGRELRAGSDPLRLDATSDSGLPVSFFVREGPAVVRDGRLCITPLPPRSRFPVKITVVAWQLGRGFEPKIRQARPVERTFLLFP